MLTCEPGGADAGDFRDQDARYARCDGCRAVIRSPARRGAARTAVVVGNPQPGSRLLDRDAELVVVAKPTYKATYTGLLRLFLDRFAGGLYVLDTRHDRPEAYADWLANARPVIQHVLTPSPLERRQGRRRRVRQRPPTR